MGLRAYLVGGAVMALLALFVLVGWQGYVRGYDAAVAVHQAELFAQIEAGQKLDMARRKALAERDVLARSLEEGAYADPIIVDRCLSPDRVRRLNALH